MSAETKSAAKLLRLFRKIHRKIALVLFVFFLIIAVSGLLLGWKKNSFGLILPPSASGSSTNLRSWLPIDSLQQIAFKTLHDSISSDLSTELERIDIRPQKGIVKFVFVAQYQEIQLDGKTGKVLQLNHRNSDIIENIHDGTILDRWFNTSGDPFKIGYTTILGLSLISLTLTGFWLWYGPERMRRKKRL